MKRKKSSKKKRILWDKSLQFVFNVFKYKKQFLNEEMFGLTPLLIRSTTSVASLIAETYESKTVKRQLRLLSISQSTLSECLDYLITIDNQGLGNTEKLVTEAEQVSALLESYIKALKQ